MKQIIAWLLAFSIIIGWFPVTAAATDVPLAGVEKPNQNFADDSANAQSEALSTEAKGPATVDTGSGFQVVGDFQSLEVCETGPLDVEITVSGHTGDTSNLVAPGNSTVFQYTSWEELIKQYVEYGVNGFAELSFDHCMEVMAEEVYNAQVIWIGLLDEQNIEVLGCTYTIADSEITTSNIDLTIEKVYQVLWDGQAQTLSTTNRLHLTYSDDNRLYIQSDVRLDNDVSMQTFDAPQQDYITNSYSTGYPNTWTNTGDQAQDIAQIALTQVGYKETNNHTKYNAWYYGSDTYAHWCAIFISWCANQAGISTSVVKKNAVASGYTLSNMSSNSFGAPAYAFGAKTPQAGDIAYINNDSDGASDHVGLVYAVDSNYIYTVEGNYSNKVSTVKYSRSSGVHSSSSGTSIMFFARPNYTRSQPEESFSYTLHVWISDTDMGTPPGVYRTGHSYYLCYEVYDTDTGVALNTSHPGQSYTATEKVIRPDGSTRHEATFDSWDSSWIRCSMDATGQFSGVVTLSGDLDLSVTVSWVVQDSISVRVLGWASDSAFGDQLDEVLQGVTCYACYTLVDSASGTPVDDLPGTHDYYFIFSVYNPDGSLVHSYTSYDDSGWISFTPQYVGEYKITAQLEGSISGGTYSGTREGWIQVTENPPQISSSSGSIDLTLGGTESATIDVTKTGYYGDGSWNFYATRSNSNIFFSWGDWSGSTCPITITALSEGTTTLTLDLIDDDTHEILDSCTVNVTVSAKSYTVSYNANGGSGAPSSQTKNHGTNLTLSSTVPTRFGYNFLGWSTSSTATSPSYYSGDTYSDNASTTLYAVWGTPGEISGNYAGFTRAATINNGGAGVYYKFTPYTSTYYRIYGIDDQDTRVYLYDASGNQLGSNDDGGEGNQFQLDYNFTAGNTYYVYVRYYSSTQTGTLDYKIAYGYRIHYNANGGSGAPSTTYKYYDFDATLSETVPTKSGATFLGWATSSSATTAEYQPGATFSENTNITLYAVWEQNSYTVSYDANGGAGAPSSQIKTPGEDLTLSTTLPARFGYAFLGWSTSPSATSATYLPGGTFTTDADTTLYAVWQSAYVISSSVTSKSYSATIPFARACKYFSFTPSFSGKVRFESTGDLDTQVYLFYPSGTQLDTDDDDGDGRNFLLDHSVTSGTTYYVQVRMYGSSTGTIDFSVKRIYDVTYDANGGSGAPAAQTKVHGIALTLSTTVPTRDGYTFLGWAQSSAATSAGYQPGSYFSTESDMTLYAVWEANCDNGHSYTYSVTKTPTASATGTLTGTCSRCSGTTTVTLPKLNSTDYTYTVVKEATCLTDGTGRYTWKTTAYGNFSFSVTLAALGHDYVNGICTRCKAQDPDWNDDIVDSGTCGDHLTWTLNDMGVLTISGTGPMDNYQSTAQIPWAEYTFDAIDHDMLTSVVIEEGVTSIGDMAFYSARGVQSVVIPSTVNSIGASAFNGCIYLESIVIPGNVKSIGPNAFADCQRLEDLVISDGVEVIGQEAFYACISLTTVRIPRSVKEIGESAFGSFSFLTGNLQSIYIFSRNCTIGDTGFGDTLGDPAKTTVHAYGGSEAAAYAKRYGYAWIEMVSEIVIDSGWSGATEWALTSDGVLRFYGNGNMKNYGWGGNQPWAKYVDRITTVVIEDGVTSVGSGAFKGMTGLRSVELPDSLTQIGIAAFYGCSSLEEIYIPDGIYTIWEYTFKNCTSLENVRLPKTLIKIDQGAFEACISLTELFLPTNTQIIGGWSFKGCTSLESVDMQWADATEIRAGAFKNCTALTHIILPENIQILGDSCFYGIGATSFTVPDTVTSIEAWCFARAYSLKNLYFEGDAPTIGTGAFNKITLTAHYPGGNTTWTVEIMQNYGGTVVWTVN